MRMWRRSALSARAIVGSIAALLMLVQSLAVLASASSNFSSGNPMAGVIASSFAANCGSDTAGGGEPPGKDQRDCPQCCVFCGGSDSGAPSSLDAPCAADAQVPMAKASASVGRRWTGDNDGRPIGWANSWSPRAPPPLS